VGRVPRVVWIDHWSVYFLAMLHVTSRVALMTMMTALACEPPPAHTAVPVEPVESPTRAEPGSYPTHTPARPLPPAIEIAGLPAAPATWPDPIPTLWDDGALSIRALRLEPGPLVVGADAGEVVRVWVYVQGHEHGEGGGEPLRTWVVDRTIDLERLDQGIALEPALAMARPGARIQVIGQLLRTDVLRPIAWAELGTETWQTPDGSVAPGPWPPETEPGPLLRRGVDDRPLTLADNLDDALDRLDSAALADDGALAERHARQALALAPDNLEVWSTLIAIYHGYGHHEHHLAAMRAARTQAASELDGLWLDYGSLDVTIGEFGHAIPLLEQALALAPESLPAHFHLATAHWLLGQRDAAEPSYLKVVELAGPMHPAIEFMMIDTAKTRLAELAEAR
jgi:hypothetical protein